MAVLPIRETRILCGLGLACFFWGAGARANTILAADTPGEPGLDVDARASAMGGAALGLFDGTNVNALNPAVPASYGRAVFNFTLARGYNSYETDAGRSVEVSYDMPIAELSIPLTRVFAGTVRFSQVLNTNFEETSPLEYEGEIIGTNRRRGRGSVYGLGAGVAARVGERWYVGGNAAYDFGAPKDVYIRDFTEKGFSDVTETLEESYKGLTLGLGAGYKVNAKLSCGAMAELAAVHKVHHTLSNDFATLEESDHRFSLPWSAGAGAAYVIGPRGRLAADVRYTAWSAFRVDGAGYGYRDTLAFGGGAEGRLTTARKTFFLWRMPYRVGAFYVPWYARNHGVMAKAGVAVGAGYPFLSNEESRLDVTLEYARRGNLAANGITEETFNFYMSVVGLETWLGKREAEE